MKKSILAVLVFFVYNSYAQQISQLPIATGKGQGMFVPVVDVGITKKLSVSNILSYSDSLKAVIDAALATKQATDAAVANVKDYGATGNGTTDDLAAFNAAVATGKIIYVPAGIYNITGAVQLLANQKMYGQGRKSIIKQLTDNRAVITAVNCEISNILFQGKGRDINFFGSNAGIYISAGSIGFKIYDCWFEDFAGANFSSGGGGGIYGELISTGFSNGGQITNCYFTNNSQGINLGVRSEYITITACTFGQNKIGLLIQTGNITVTGCVLQSNDINIKLDAGPNNGHNIIANTISNHSVNHNLYIQDTNNGMAFIGCEFNVGNIFISNSPKMRFIGCGFINSPSYSLTVNASDIYIYNSKYPVSPTATAFAVTLGAGGTITQANNLDF